MQNGHNQTENLKTWYIFVILVIIIGILGYWGFAEAYGSPVDPVPDGSTVGGTYPSPSELTYRTIQLFVLEYPTDIPVAPIQLEFARFLAPVLTISSLAIIFWIMFDRLKGFRLLVNPGHIVICGCGYLGPEIARHFRRGKQKRYVVVIENDPAKKDLDACRQPGVMVILGDATQEQVLKRARVHRASEIFLVTGNDGVNAEIAVACSRLSDEFRDRWNAEPRKNFRGLLGALPGFVPKNQVPRCHIHLEDPNISKAFIQAHPVTQSGGRTMKMEFFNLYRIAGYCMQKEHPPFYDPHLNLESDPHVLIIGCGRMGESLIIRIVRQWKKRVQGRKIRITCIDADAKARVREIVACHPTFEDYCTIEPVSMDVRSEEFASGSFLDRGKSHPFTRAYICLGDSSLCIATVFSLTERMKVNNISIIVRSTYLDGATQLLEAIRREKEYSHIVTFPIVASRCCIALIAGGFREMIGQAIHAGYREERLQEGQCPTDDPALEAWEDLDYEEREQNFDQAEDIRRKLNTIGCDIAPASSWDEPLFDFSPDEVEHLARMEHERWMKKKLEFGYHYGSERNKERKTSPYLVPFDELGKEVQDRDRRMVKDIPKLLKRLDLTIVWSFSPYRETLAQTIHETYLEAERAKGYTRQGNPPLVPWEELNEGLRESNRQQAIDIGRKLSLIGCGVRFRPEPDTGLFTFSDCEIDLLAEKEHERWMKEKAATGWIYGEKKDPVRKTHPFLVPYSKLTNEDKDRGKLAVKSIPNLLAKVNLKIVRDISPLHEGFARAAHKAYAEQELREDSTSKDDPALKT